jgi:hypothetical protein
LNKETHFEKASLPRKEMEESKITSMRSLQKIKAL